MLLNFLNCKNNQSTYKKNSSTSGSNVNSLIIILLLLIKTICCNNSTRSTNNNDNVNDCLKSTNFNSALLCFENIFQNSNENSFVRIKKDVKVFSEEFDRIISDSSYATNFGNTLVNITKARTEDGDVNFQIQLSNKISEISEVTERKMKMKMQNFLPFLVAPAFFLAGIMPWIMPKLKLAVFLVGLINNMVFFQALFSLVRNYVFNKAKDEHIIYLNHGYKDKEVHVHHPPVIYHNPHHR